MEEWLPVVIAALISGFFAYSVGIKQGEVRGVIDDRKSWRDYFRMKWTKKLTKMVMKYEKNGSNQECVAKNLEDLKHQYMVRMNPKRDEKILSHIKILQELVDTKASKSAVIESADYIVRMMSRLLKEDWERVKTDLSLLGKFPKMNLLILSGLYVATVFLIVGFVTANPDKGWMLWGSIIITTVVFFKVFLGELDKIPEFRQMLYPNFLDGFPDLCIETMKKEQENNHEQGKKNGHVKSCLYQYEDLRKLENAVRKAFVLIIVFSSLAIIVVTFLNILNTFEMMLTVNVTVIFGGIMMFVIVVFIVSMTRILLRISQTNGGR